MKREKITITTPFIKLDALLKFSGIAQTGGHAKEMITGRMVSVDGEVCLQRGRKIVPGMVVTLSDILIEVVKSED